MAKQKCTFTDEMQTKHSCFRKGRSEYEAECLVCKPGTYISVIHKDSSDLSTQLMSEKHCKAVRGAAASTKMMNYFVARGSNREDAIAAVEGTFAFPTVTHHNNFYPWNVHWHCLKRFFLILV